jgi:ABC-2 type transport system ATP-binding protein
LRKPAIANGEQEREYSLLSVIHSDWFMIPIKIEAVNLTKRFGEQLAVDHICLQVNPGEILGFLGPNGAGKTTAIRMFCGLLRPDEGEVLFNGLPLHSLPNGKSMLGMCPQENVHWERLTCLEQMMFIGEMYDLSRRDARDAGKQLLEQLGLTAQSDKQARRLSGGMKRRLNIALALVHDPAVLILDEPEAGLDPQSRLLMREFIRNLAGTRTIILTTHNMDEADRLSSRVAIIDAGKILMVDTPENLKSRYPSARPPVTEDGTTLEDVFIQLTGKQLRS